MITLHLNPFRPSDMARCSEIMTCLHGNLSNRLVDRFVIYSSEEIIHSDSNGFGRIRFVANSRPKFSDFVREIDTPSEGGGVQVIINSDCVLTETAAKFLRRCKPGEAYCIRRRELVSIFPLVYDRSRESQWRASVPNSMHDGWAFSGLELRAGSLNFYPGVPGCDNRLAYELAAAGYRVSEVCESAPLLHLHRSLRRSYTSADSVPGPYLHPPRIHMRERYVDFLRWLSSSCIGVPLRAVHSIRKWLQRSPSQ
jgi:hypothetical protein